jgi:hypothetical protein
MMYLPPRAIASMPSRAVAEVPTKSIAAAIGPLRLLHRIGRTGVDRGGGTCPKRRLALLRLDVGDDRSLAAHRLVKRQTHETKAARAYYHDRLLPQDRLADPLQGTVSGEARTSVRRRLTRAELAEIEQVARVRH